VGRILFARAVCQSLLLVLLLSTDGTMSNPHSDDVQTAIQQSEAYGLARKRRAALEQVDKASFRYVVDAETVTNYPLFIWVPFQPFSYQGVLSSWCWVLYGCVWYDGG